MDNDIYPYRYFSLPISESHANGAYFQGVPTDRKDVVEFPYPNFIDMVDVFNNVGYEGDVPFRNGKKPTRFLKHLFTLAGLEEEKEAIIMDFFSGSATTADAIMQLNASDGGSRRYIMVQLPEVISEKDEAYKIGLKTICEIGKERIRRSGEKVRQESNNKLDTGFKVFKLDTSNIKKWTPDYDNLEETLFDQINNFVEDRTELDVVYEIMLKYGIDLTFPIEEYEVSGKKVYSVGFGALMICLDNDITTDLAIGIIKLKEELAPDIMRVVFKDNGFRNDSVKTNVKEIFKVNGIDEMVSI